jgi:hypothetical protein
MKQQESKNAELCAGEQFRMAPFACCSTTEFTRCSSFCVTISSCSNEKSNINASWLCAHRLNKPLQKIQDVAHLDADALAAERKKARGRSKPLSVAEVKCLKAEHATSLVPLQTLAGEAHTLESRDSDLVNAAYRLSPDEIALMWQTAPPRMPVAEARR